MSSRVCPAWGSAFARRSAFWLDAGNPGRVFRPAGVRSGSERARLLARSRSTGRGRPGPSPTVPAWRGSWFALDDPDSADVEGSYPSAGQRHHCCRRVDASDLCARKGSRQGLQADTGPGDAGDRAYRLVCQCGNDPVVKRRIAFRHARSDHPAERAPRVREPGYEPTTGPKIITTLRSRTRPTGDWRRPDCRKVWWASTDCIRWSPSTPLRPGRI